MGDAIPGPGGGGRPVGGPGLALNAGQHPHELVGLHRLHEVLVEAGFAAVARSVARP